MSRDGPTKKTGRSRAHVRRKERERWRTCVTHVCDEDETNSYNGMASRKYSKSASSKETRFRERNDRVGSRFFSLFLSFLLPSFLPSFLPLLVSSYFLRVRSVHEPSTENARPITPSIGARASNFPPVRSDSNDNGLSMRRKNQPTATTTTATIKPVVRTTSTTTRFDVAPLASGVAAFDGSASAYPLPFVCLSSPRLFSDRVPDRYRIVLFLSSMS